MTAVSHETSHEPHRAYRPSNMTEASIFAADFCFRCRHPRGRILDMCPIAADAFAFDAADPEYPREWTYDEGGEATCTAFAPKKGTPR